MKMRPSISPFALLLAVVVFCPACSHYGNLSADFDTYSPPAIVSPPVSPALKPAEDLRADADFINQKARLDEMGRQWEAALNAPGADPRFYSPAQDRLSSLEPAGRDAAAAVRALSPDLPWKRWRYWRFLETGG